jgi:hypothetical protein
VGLDAERPTALAIAGCGAFMRARVDGKIASAGDFAAAHRGSPLRKVASSASADNTVAYVQDQCARDNFRRPRSILLNGDIDEPRVVLGKMAWRNWGRAKATATGELQTAPPCASRSRRATGHRLRLALSERVRQPGAPEVDRFRYRRMDLAVNGRPDLSGEYELPMTGIPERP